MVFILRSYDVNDKQLPSVTTIIHILGSDRLMSWANIMGFKRKDIKAILKETSEYGTCAHEIARAAIEPGYEPQTKDLPYPYCLRINELQKRVRLFAAETSLTPKFTEHTMVSEELGYGGTCDIFGDITYQGKTYHNIIMDWKTAKTVHDTMWLQTGGYYNLLKKEGIEAEGAAIIRISHEYVRFTFIPIEELKNYADGFDALHAFYKFWGNRDS